MYFGFNRALGHELSARFVGRTIIVDKIDRKAYWAATKQLTIMLLSIWFLVSFGAGILFRALLDNFRLGGAPLGFWFAQNGSIYIFVCLIFYYCWAMSKIERKFGIKG